MKTVQVTIKGATPLLQHRFAESDEQPGATRPTLVNRGTPREEASKCCYQLKDGTFYFPSSWIAGTLVSVAGNHKLKGSRKSARFVVPAAVLVMDESIPITNGDGKTKVTDFEVDSRPVTIPATKGRVMRHRPRFDCWSATFKVRVNEQLLPVDFVHRLLDEAGQQVGIGDYRPEKRGPFGTFVVMEWRE